MTFLSVTPGVASVVVESEVFSEALPPFVFLNWDAPSDHLQFWFEKSDGERYFFEPINPGYTTSQSTFRKLAQSMALQLVHWPHALPFIWADRSALRAIDVIHESGVQVLDTALGFLQPMAHPNGNLYWLAVQTFTSYRVMKWDPLTGNPPQTLVTLDTDLPIHSWHQKDGQDYLIYSKDFNTAGVIDLATGTEVAQHETRILGPLFAEFADPQADRFVNSLYGAAYGGQRPINVALVENGQYESTIHAIARGTPGSSAIPSGSQVALRFNLSRSALSVYPYESIDSGKLKFFDPRRTETQSPNNNNTEAVVQLPTLNPEDPTSHPDQAFPATTEPF